METVQAQLAHLSAEQRRLVELWLRQKQASHSASPASDQLPRRDPKLPAALSFAQQRLWFMHLLEPDSPAYNLRTIVRLQGSLDLTALQRSLTAIIERHEVLRTSFPSQDGQPLQVIAPAVPLPLPLIDLHHLPPDEQPAQIQQHALQETEQPFDLAHGPLLRACLLRLSASEHVLVLTMHHSISDGWSQGIQLRELDTLYGAFARGRPSPLPELPIQYADFAAWQRRWLQGERLAQLLAYWQEHLGAHPHVLDLPTDHPRPIQASGRGAWDYFTFPLGLRDQLTSLSRREGVTLFMTLLAAFNVLLSHYSGQEDIVVGTPVAGRTRPELEGLIGCFVNMLPLRTNLAGNPSFAELLRRVRAVLLGAYAHQELPFEQLVEVMQVPRDLSRNPIFQVLFVLQNMPMPALSSGELTFLPQEVSSTTATLDLSLYVREVPDGLLIRVEYNTDLFEPATIGRMLGQYQTLLAGIVADPARPLAGLPLLGPQERQRLLVDWNATSVPYPQTTALDQVFEAQAARMPDAIAVICPSSRSGQSDEHVTYAQLNRRANQLARHLHGCGVGAEVRVGVCLERSLELVLALLAILKAGATYVPLDPTYPPDRLAWILQDTQPAALITTQRDTVTRRQGDKVTETAQEVTVSPLHPFTVSGPEVVDLDRDWLRIAQQPADNLGLRSSADQTASIVYTSGSTGRPKGVMQPQHQLLNRFAWMWRAYPFGAGEVGVQKTTINFADSIWELLGGLLQGVPTAIIPDALVRDIQQLMDMLARQHVTRILLVPALLRMLLDLYPDLHARLPRLKLWVASGEALTLDLAQRFYAQMPACRLINLYGTSEAFDSTVAEVPADLSTDRHVTIGRPLDNVQAYILDRYFMPVPLGVAGELCIAGAGLARGYLNHPDLTAEKFVPNPFSLEDRGWKIEDSHPDDTEMLSSSQSDRGLKIEENNADADHERSSNLYPPSSTRLYRTGDLARYRPDGQIEYLGRLDHQIKLRGVRIEPGEIERALAEHPAVRQAVVVARPDQTGEARLVAYLVPTTDDRPLTTDLRDEVTRRQGDKVTEDRATFTRSPVHPFSVSESLVVGRQSSVVGELRAFLQDRLPATMIPSVFVVLDALPLTPNGKVNRRALPTLEAVPLESVAYVAPSTPAEIALARIWEQVLGVPRVGIHDNFFALRGDSLLTLRVAAQAKQAGLAVSVQQLLRYQTIAELAAAIGGQTLEHADQAIGVLPYVGQLQVCEDPSPDFVAPIELPPGIGYTECYQIVQHVFRHHDILRLKLERAGDQRIFSIAPPDEGLILHRIEFAADLLKQGNSVLLATLEAVKQEFRESNQGYARFTYVSFDGLLPNHLFVILDHVMYDHYALPLLFGDIELCISQLNQGLPIHLPLKTTSYRKWAIKMNEYFHSACAAEHLAYWRGLPWQSVYKIPMDHPRGYANPVFGRKFHFALEKSETQALFDRIQHMYQANMIEVLLGGIVFSMSTCFPIGEKPISVAMLANQRIGVLGEDVDMSRTLGNFAVTCNILLWSHGNTNGVELLRSVQQQIKHVPLEGKTHSWFLRHDETQLDNVRSGIILNYWGRVPEKQKQSPLLELLSPQDLSSERGAVIAAEDDIEGMLRWPEYVFDRLEPGARYLLRLHFVELHMNKPGKRYFDVWLNRALAITKLDIIQLAGAMYKAITTDLTCSADAAGRIVLNLVSYRDSPGKATISGIELWQLGPSSTYDGTELHPIVKVNAGGQAVGEFQAGQYAAGGSAYTTDHPIDLTGLTIPAPLAVYQSECTCSYKDTTDEWPRLNLTGQVQDDRLEFSIDWCPNLHRRETVEALSQSLFTYFRTLLEQPAPEPSPS